MKKVQSHHLEGIADLLEVRTNIAWSTVLHAYMCNVYALDRSLSSDSVWRAVWARVLGTKRTDAKALRQRVSKQRTDLLAQRDPVLPYISNGALVALGMSHDEALIEKELAAATESLNADYMTWRANELGF